MKFIKNLLRFFKICINIIDFVRYILFSISVLNSQRIWN